MLVHIFQTVNDILSTDTTAKITILGDFNDLQTDTIECNLGMSQLITFFTRHNATLDKLFTNCPTLFTEP